MMLATSSEQLEPAAGAGCCGRTCVFPGFERQEEPQRPPR
jgi:hypothetical protein